jgi:hypothetical protein
MHSSSRFSPVHQLPIEVLARAIRHFHAFADRLRRPRWRSRQLSTNIPPGPLNAGWSIFSQCLV